MALWNSGPLPHVSLGTLCLYHLLLQIIKYCKIAWAAVARELTVCSHLLSCYYNVVWIWTKWHSVTYLTDRLMNWLISSARAVWLCTEILSDFLQCLPWVRLVHFKYPVRSWRLGLLVQHFYLQLFHCRSRRALEHRKNLDEDRLAELEQMVKDASDSVMETEKRFAEVCSVVSC